MLAAAWMGPALFLSFQVLLLYICVQGMSGRTALLNTCKKNNICQQAFQFPAQEQRELDGREIDFTLGPWDPQEGPD